MNCGSGQTGSSHRPPSPASSWTLQNSSPPLHLPLFFTSEGCRVEMEQVVLALHLVCNELCCIGGMKSTLEIYDYCCIRSKPRIRENPLASVFAKCFLRDTFEDPNVGDPTNSSQ